MLSTKNGSPRTTCQAVALVVARFEAALKDVAATGRCEHAQLYSTIEAMRLHVTGTVQPCEGVNSLIKVVDQRCAHIGLPLLCARIKLKKALGLGSRHAPKGWRQRREGAQKLVDLCNSVSAQWREVRKEQRYTTPAPVVLQPPFLVQFDVTAKRWAAVWAMYLNKRLQQNFSDGKDSVEAESMLDYCVLIGRKSQTYFKRGSSVRPDAWIVAGRHKKLMTAVRCSARPDQNDADGSFVLDIVIPLDIARPLGVPWCHGVSRRHLTLLAKCPHVPQLMEPAHNNCPTFAVCCLRMLIYSYARIFCIYTARMSRMFVFRIDLIDLIVILSWLLGCCAGWSIGVHVGICWSF